MDQPSPLRAMSGQKRLNQAFQLSDFVRELAAKGRQSAQGKSKQKENHGSTGPAGYSHTIRYLFHLNRIQYLLTGSLA